jgi:HK97 family phage prohead protease
MNKPTGIEKRAVAGLRAESQGEELALVGRAASFNVLSPNLQGFRERIAPGAFTRSLAKQVDIKCLLNHDPSLILGRTKSGTLKVWQDDRGLNYRCQLDHNQQMHRDLHSAIKRGDLDQCSFSFSLADGDGDFWDEGEENGERFVRRTLRNLDLLDVSPVTFPYYDSEGATAVAARHAGGVTDAARRARCAAIGEAIRADRIASAGRDVAEDLKWLRRMAEIPRN